MKTQSTNKMPVLFVGHGNPMLSVLLTNGKSA